jgi:hypothetical protein
VPIPEKLSPGARARTYSGVCADGQVGHETGFLDPISSICVLPGRAEPAVQTGQQASASRAGVSLARGIKAPDAKYPFYGLYSDTPGFVSIGGNQKHSQVAQTSNGASAPEGSPCREFLRGLWSWVRQNRGHGNLYEAGRGDRHWRRSLLRLAVNESSRGRLNIDFIAPVFISCALLWWVSRGMSWTARLVVTAITLAVGICIVLFERRGFF